MKQIVFIILAACYISLLPSCKEVGPDINLHGNPNAVSDTTYIEQPVESPEAKNVVIEEFTGVQCPNCPAGDVVIADLQAQYPGRVIGIALHPDNAFGYPFTFSLQNLIDTNSTLLSSYLGYPGFEPNAGIDRQLFSGQTSILIDRSYWSGVTAQEIVLTPQANILLSDVYSTSTRQLTVTAELHYTQTVSQPNNITIALTEDSVITAQLNGSVIDTFYVHNGILRNVITGTTGDNVAYAPTVTLVAGRVVRLVYQTTLLSGWNANNMHVVAFVHEHATLQVIYQGAEINVVN